MKQSILYLLLLFSILTLKGQTIDKPNIVFIYADDLGWQDTQLNDVGDVVPWETPNMLALAESGANFSQAYASAPSCAPSRGGTMSGRMPLKNKMTHVAGGQIPKVKTSNKTIESYYPGRLQIDEVTIAEALNPLGYVSGHIGKWHMAANHNIYPEAVDQGFDYQDTDRGITRSMGDRSVDFATDAEDDPYRLDEDGRPYDAVTELALDFMDDNKEEPFFLYMAHWLVHSPIQTRDLALLTYYCDKLGIPVPTTDANITTPGQTNPYYGAMIASLDWSLGRVVDYLKETDDPRNPGKKLFETTYIIFSSDNGGAENHGSEIITDNFPLDLGKTHTKEGGLRTPLVIAGPGIVENQIYDNMVSHLDFYPTIMEVTGADAHTDDASVIANLDGVSLYPFLSGTETEIKNSDDTERTDLFWHYPHGQDERASSAIRSGNYKLYKIYDNGGYYKAYKLYNADGSDNDIEEMFDVIDTMDASLKNEMILKLETLLSENNVRVPQFNPDYTGDPLDNQDIVPSVVSTVFDDATGVATATLTTNAGDAIIETAYILYRIEEVDSSEEEWFEISATINGNVITADVPEVATGVIFTLTDENNFMVLSEELSIFNPHKITLADTEGEQSFKVVEEYAELIGNTTIGGTAYLQARTEEGGDGAKFYVKAPADVETITCDKITLGIISQSGDTVNVDIIIDGETQSFTYVSTNNNTAELFEFDTPVTFTQSAKEIQVITTSLSNSNVEVTVPRVRFVDLFFNVQVIDPIDGTYTNADDAGTGTWATATNWTNSIIANETGIATLQRTIDLETNSYTVGQVLISGNDNTKTFSNGTIILEGTTSSNTDQIIRNRSNKIITIDCNVTVNVNDKVIQNRNISKARLIFGSSSTLALGTNTVNVDNPLENEGEVNEGTVDPIEFNGNVTGDATSSINIIDHNMSIGSTSDFSGFTGSITFGGTNGLLTVNGVNTIEGSIGVLAASDGNSIIEFNANQSGLANLTVDTQALAIDFDAAATAVEFTGYTTSTTEGVVDLQNYVSGSLRIGTNATSISQTILNTWLIDGVEPADGTLVQDESGYINVQASVQNIITFLQAAPNGEWQTTTNWDTGTLPLTTDQALILYSGDLTLDQSRTIGNLKFQTNIARSFLDAGSTILTLDTPFSSNSRLIDNTSSKAITIYPSINFMASGVIYNRNKVGNQLIFTGGTIYINSNTITIDSRSTHPSNQYIVFNGPVDGDGIINVDDSIAGGSTQGISLGADANFSTFTGTINAKNNPIVSSTTNAFGSALTLDGTASFEINVASTFTGSISRLATTAGAATITFNANQSMGTLTVDTQALAIDFDAAATAVEFTGYTTSTTEGIVDLQNYVSGSLRIGTSATSVPSVVLDTWTIDGVAANLVQDASGYIITTNTWNGSTNSDWTVGDNWSLTTAPSTTENVIIPTGLTNYPTIATDVTVNNVSLVDEASLLFSGTGALTTTTSVTYERTIDANKWYLMSSPVVGESYDDDWITANGIASGQGSNRGIGYYDNTSSDEQTGHWRYFQSGGNATAFNSGQGYSIIRSTAGAVTFTGSGVYTTSQTKAISQSVGNFSLVSNPFTGYLNLGDFFTDNNSANLLENNTIYVWNADIGDYDTKVSEVHSSYEIAHGQAIFVEAGTVGGTLNLDINDVTHQGGSDNFQKTSNTFSKIYITLSDENNTNRNAEIYFIEGATTGFDNGYDGELFGGASHSFALFSELLEDNGKNYQIQSLPTSLKQSAIIPLGLIANKGLEINISTEIENLPLDVFVYLEDREKGTFTLLNDNASFNFTTEETLNGKGRFYLHTSAKVLSTVNETLKNVSIYKLDNSILKIKGLSQGEANIKLFDTFGKQLMNNSFDSNGSQQQINLPKLATGIYIVQLKTDVGTLNKKIFLE